MPNSPSFQDIIFRLQSFWGARGCVLLQPQDCEVGAGTFHPATFLRAVGPEPWRACYVQPSRRPQDGRYGDNPNRLQHYYQFQAVMKPSPDDFQQLYLQSLAELGVRAADNDIRFVEDDWESPTLGAWGLGWEVWLNGMEISQFTYFQEAGGRPVKPVMGEITYGLERLAMFLQGCENVFDLRWAEWTDENGKTKTTHYKDIHLQSEKEHSVYNFERADTKLLARHFDEYEAAAAEILGGENNGKNGKPAKNGGENKPLPLPGYEMVMKCSHLFNLLDARGVISVTERARYIARVRNLARRAAKAYYESREELGFPLCKKSGKDGKKTRP